MTFNESGITYFMNRKKITAIILFILFLNGCSTTASIGGIYLPTHENACRNHHKFFASKGQRYKCVDIYSDGSKYDGQFINDFVRDGYGTMHYADGSKYEGEFRDDKLNGQGKLYDASGSLTFSGLFEDNKPIPQSTLDRRKEIAEQQQLENQRRARQEQEIRAQQQREDERRVKQDQERRIEQQRQNELAAQKERERISKEGDGTPDDSTCKKYGLRPQTSGYAECRMRIDFAKAESKRQQDQYEREQALYASQIAAIERERERRRGAAFMELGARMMSGQRTLDAINSVGSGAPIAPRKPESLNHTITLPNGRMINCSTFGSMTNCF